MAGESRCWPGPVAAALGLHAAPTGTLADSEQPGRARLAKPFHVAGLPDPSSSAVLPMPASSAAPASRSARCGHPPAHSRASGPGLDGQAMAFM